VDVNGQKSLHCPGQTEQGTSPLGNKGPDLIENRGSIGHARNKGPDLIGNRGSVGHARNKGVELIGNRGSVGHAGNKGRELIGSVRSFRFRKQKSRFKQFYSRSETKVQV
jgi:hypothetical protein